MGLNDRRSRSSEAGGVYRAEVVELFSREIVANTNTSTKIYSRDADNLYPIRIDRVINNSPTGRRCANLMTKYIIGLGNRINYKIGRKAGKDYFINDLIRESASYIPKQYGVYFKLKYLLDLSASNGSKIVFTRGEVSVLDYASMARSKEDDLGNDGKYYRLDIDADGNIKDGDGDLTDFYYAYNFDSKVILAQMHKDCELKGISNPTMEDLITNYRGQVFYMNLTPEYIYALPLGDSVYNDMDTEFRIANYNNTQTRTGFLGKTIVVRYETEETEENRGENDDFDEELKTFLGAENSGSVFTVEIPQDANVELDKAFVVQQLKPQFDDKLFEKTNTNIRQNILGAFNNIPEPLIFAGAGALFGTSADTYSEMKKFYWEQNEYERSTLEQTLRLFGFDVDIVPIKGMETKKEDANV